MSPETDLTSTTGMSSFFFQNQPALAGTEETQSAVDARPRVLMIFLRVAKELKESEWMSGRACGTGVFGSRKWLIRKNRDKYLGL